MLAQHKRSKAPGDNKEMVQARRAFLQQGHYQPLAARIASLIAEHTTTSDLSIFDAGCGEGDYLHRIVSQLKQQQIDVQSAGCDVSKVAIQYAAKRDKQGQFAVASCFDLPLEARSQDVVIQVFAPSATDEIARVLKPGGLWLRVNPAATHLHQLKACLYDQPQLHSLDEIQHTQLQQVERLELRFDLSLDSAADRRALLMMTPYYWSASKQAKHSFEHSDRPCEAAFDILLMRRSSS